MPLLTTLKRRPMLVLAIGVLGISMSSILVRLSAAPSAVTAAYRLLWKRFYDTISIRERENPRGRMSKMPKRYWGTMTEFQSEEFFVPSSHTPRNLEPALTPSVDAAFPAPSAPDGTPAPATPPEYGHSAPV